VKKTPISERKPRPIFCCICRTVFGSGEDHVSYVHHNGERVDVCYKHIFSLVNQEGTYFKKLPTKQERSFDLITYLNATRKVLSTKPLLNEKAQKTLTIIYEIIDSTKLSKYFVNGMADFLRRGLRPSQYPKPEQENIAA
jgi:hypothetical protein